MAAYALGRLLGDDFDLIDVDGSCSVVLEDATGRPYGLGNVRQQTLTLICLRHGRRDDVVDHSVRGNDAERAVDCLYMCS